MLGLYIHVPFCASICNYCNFNRGLFDAALKTRYLDALITEITKAPHHAESLGQPAAQNSVAQGASSVDTVYFGGGTPSLLAPEDVASILTAIHSTFDIGPDAEITLEANPETVDRERLDGFLAAGVNRLSFGVQSFRDEDLQRLERRHSASAAAEAFVLARQAGFRNISLDLMMWLPQQTTSQWLESVDAALAFVPEHMSMYMLEVYPHLPLRQAMTERHWMQLPDDDVADMYERAMQRCEAAGYQQYEISNVALPGFRSRHNLKYWQDGEWLGFGPGAHSTRGGTRWKNVSSTDDYVSRLTVGGSGIAERRCLSPAEQLGDALFTGLRLNDGVDLDAVSQRYGTDIWRTYGERLALFIDAGLLVKDTAGMRLTRQGMLLAHEVMAVFV